MPLTPSKSAYDWLGSGIYFWEHNPQRALLQVDSSKARALLGCDSKHFAPFSFEAGVAELFGKLKG